MSVSLWKGGVNEKEKQRIKVKDLKNTQEYYPQRNVKSHTHKIEIDGWVDRSLKRVCRN